MLRLDEMYRSGGDTTTRIVGGTERGSSRRGRARSHPRFRKWNACAHLGMERSMDGVETMVITFGPSQTVYT